MNNKTEQQHEDHAHEGEHGFSHSHGHNYSHGQGAASHKDEHDKANSTGGGHGHSHGLGHSHGTGANRPRVMIALCLTGSFMVIEVIGGLISGSLALLADAAHMLLDTVALFLTWLAFGLAEKPADHSRSYGYHRFPILVAFTNGITMLFIVGWIFYETVERLLSPTEILATPMLVVASIGLMVNILAAWVLMGADRDNLNIRGALIHVMGDLLGSVAAIGAALVIMYSGWTMIDPLLSALVAALILRSAWGLIRDAGHILLEGTPAHLDTTEIGKDLEQHVDQVEEVHHVHAWSLSQDRLILTLHARISEHAHADIAVNGIHNRLAERFDIDHVTVQIEVESCADVPVSASPAN